MFEDDPRPDQDKAIAAICAIGAAAVGRGSGETLPSSTGSAQWRIAVSDEFATWEYVIEGTDDASIEEVAKFTAAFLRGKIVEKTAQNDAS